LVEWYIVPTRELVVVRLTGSPNVANQAFFGRMENMFCRLVRSVQTLPKLSHSFLMVIRIPD